MVYDVRVEHRVLEPRKTTNQFGRWTEILAVRDGQRGERAACFGPFLVPAACHDAARDRAGEAVGREGVGVAAIDVARHLIEQDGRRKRGVGIRSEEHTSELQSLMRISYAVFCLKKKKHTQTL